jgi:hypothetical protein
MQQRLMLRRRALWRGQSCQRLDAVAALGGEQANTIVEERLRPVCVTQGSSEFRGINLEAGFGVWVFSEGH